MTSGMEMNFDRATVRKIVEDQWREIIPLRGYRMRAQNTTLMDKMWKRFGDQTEAWIKSLPSDQGDELAHIFSEELRLSAAEWNRDKVGFARRLGVLPGSVSHRQGIGEMAVRTAVRASIWEGIFRLSGGDFFTVARQLQPYRCRDSRNGNRPAAYASRQRESRGRIVGRFRRDRAQPDTGTPCTRR